MSSVLNVKNILQEHIEVAEATNSLLDHLTKAAIVTVDMAAKFYLREMVEVQQMLSILRPSSSVVFTWNVRLFLLLHSPLIVRF